MHPNDIAVYPGRGCLKIKISNDHPYLKPQDGKENSEFIKQLNIFLTRTVDIVKKTRIARTQVKESVNNNISYHAP